METDQDKKTEKESEEIWYNGVKLINENHLRNYVKAMETYASYQAGEKLDLETMIAQIRKNSKD